jgi:hypothetical protein
MKIRSILMFLLAMSMFGFSAEPPPYDDSRAPTLSLPDAYQLAVTALGSATNSFHCINAHISTDFGAPGWQFRFCSTNKPAASKFVTVEFTREIHFDLRAQK